MSLAPPDARRPRPVRGTTAVAATAALLLGASAGYEVRPGDTLSGIAAQHGTSVQAISELNGLTDPDHIVAGQELTLPAGPAVGGSPEVGALLEEVARRHGWSPAFVKAVAWQESGWDNAQVSSAGAVGIMQVLPGTGEFVSRDLVGRPLDLDVPRDNVEAGVVFLQHLWELTDGDVEQTLAGYFQGLRSVREDGLYPQTERYTANVLALRERFR